MIRILSSILLVFLCFTNMVAQDDDVKKLYARAGFKAGINYSNVTDDVPGKKPRARMHLGVAIEFPITHIFFLQAEAMYSAQGYTYTSLLGKNTISLNYLQLPIIGKYYLTKNISLETGPQLGSLASALQTISDTDEEFYNSHNKVDFSWVVGAGYKFESGLFFQLRYNTGLSRISSYDNGLNGQIRNAVAQLSIGYLFKTKNNRRPNENN